MAIKMVAIGINIGNNIALILLSRLALLYQLDWSTHNLFVVVCPPPYIHFYCNICSLHLC